MLCQTGPSASEHVMQQSPRRLSSKPVVLAQQRPSSGVNEPQNPISFILRPASQSIKTQVMSFFNSIGCAILRHHRRRRHAMSDGLVTDTYFSFLFVYRRSMQRSGPRGPKRSPTPTSTTSPNANSADHMPPASPSAPVAGTQKPLYLCSPFVEAALVKGNFKTIVMLPKYVDIMEWVAVNGVYRTLRQSQHRAYLRSYRNPNKRAVFDFFQNLNMFYGVISECCTQHSCPTMSAGAT
jgi:hypothetical protein